MIVKTANFTSVLEKYRFVNYRTYETDYILYITLYGEEDSEKFVIMEPLSSIDRAIIHAALDASQQSARMNARW
jgi:hypothetical protein